MVKVFIATKGTVVILAKESSLPLQWPLGLIEDIVPGRDDILSGERQNCLRNIQKTCYQSMPDTNSIECVLVVLSESLKPLCVYYLYFVIVLYLILVTENYFSWWGVCTEPHPSTFSVFT